MKNLAKAVLIGTLAVLPVGCKTMPAQIPSVTQKTEARVAETIRVLKALEPQGERLAKLAVFYASDGVFSEGEQEEIMRRARGIYGPIFPFGDSEIDTSSEAFYYFNKLSELGRYIRGRTLYSDSTNLRISRTGTEFSLRDLGNKTSNLDVE